jgi:hypothetical protein
MGGDGRSSPESRKTATAMEARSPGHGGMLAQRRRHRTAKRAGRARLKRRLL